MKKLLFLILLIVVVIFCYLYFFPERSATEDIERVKNTMANASVAAKVKTAISLDKDFGAFDIKTRAESGHVTLSGKVDSEALRQRAEEIASRVDGVENVENQIELK
jgi:osmotically-inducible protein OsmY